MEFRGAVGKACNPIPNRVLQSALRADVARLPDDSRARDPATVDRRTCLSLDPLCRAWWRESVSTKKALRKRQSGGRKQQRRDSDKQLPCLLVRPQTLRPIQSNR